MELFTSFAVKMFLKAIDTTLYFYLNPFLNPFISTQFQETNDKSSDWEVFWKKGVVYKNFANFTGKPLCQSLFINKVSGLCLQLY